MVPPAFSAVKRALHRRQCWGYEMESKVVRPRGILGAAFLVVPGAVVAALAGGSGARTSGKNATRAYGIVRAGSAGITSGTAVASTATAGPQVIDGTFQGTSPD